MVNIEQTGELSTAQGPGPLTYGFFPEALATRDEFQAFAKAVDVLDSMLAQARSSS